MAGTLRKEMAELVKRRASLHQSDVTGVLHHSQDCADFLLAHADRIEAMEEAGLDYIANVVPAVYDRRWYLLAHSLLPDIPGGLAAEELHVHARAALAPIPATAGKQEEKP